MLQDGPKGAKMARYSRYTSRYLKISQETSSHAAEVYVFLGDSEYRRVSAQSTGQKVSCLRL